MTKYIINKMLYDWKETIGNIIFVSCLMSVIMLCCNIALRIKGMVKEDWYKNSIEVQSIGDPFIREKLGVIVWGVIVLIGILCIFCLVLYGLKMKLDIIKESRRISVFQVLGYGYFRRCGEIYLGKFVELVLATGVASVIACVIWKYLCGQEIFWNLISLMDKDAGFQWSFVWITFIVIAVWGVINILLIVKWKLKITDMRGEER